jgi:demethylmenaquinone methyltransferase/2-methoxy-6-polyprenyl-1,4-benzoquinol methylase
MRSSETQVQTDEADFGFRRVALSDKQSLVNDVFHAVADRYDLMNDFMSAGLHREWKNIFVGKARVKRRGRLDHLDVAGGTGDIAFRMVQGAPAASEVVSTVSDINTDMLRVCAGRAEKLGLADRVTTIEANAEALPFPDASFDVYTIAFGIRNVPRRERALAEAKRVLRKGGRFLCLEFSHVDHPLIARIYDAYSFRLVPKMGEIVTGDAQPYRYLVESIRKFPRADDFRDEIANAGFARASYDLLTGGVVAIHSGWNL